MKFMLDLSNGLQLSILTTPTGYHNFTIKDARLLSTGGNEKPLDGRETIRVYFIPFLKRGDTVAFDHDDAIKSFSDVGVETGYYHFNVQDANGKPDVWVSRYTFVFVKKDGNWMIAHHHSSRVPNLTAAPAR
jgi:hypothetical protein